MPNLLPPRSGASPTRAPHAYSLSPPRDQAPSPLLHARPVILHRISNADGPNARTTPHLAEPSFSYLRRGQRNQRRPPSCSRESTALLPDKDNCFYPNISINTCALCVSSRPRNNRRRAHQGRCTPGSSPHHPELTVLQVDRFYLLRLVS